MLYVAFTGAFFIADAVLLHRLSDQGIRLWVSLRTGLLFGLFFVTFGVDQALLRQPLPLRRIVGPAMAQCVLGSTFYFVILRYVVRLDFPFLALPLLMLLSYSALLGGYLRSQYLLVRSQIAINGWRAVTLVVVSVAVLTSHYSVATVAAYLLLGCPVCLCALIGAKRHGVTTDAHSADRYHRLFPLSSRFWLLGLVAAGLSYLDQLVLAADASAAATATYFRYATYFVTVSTLATSAAAQVLNPYIRSYQGTIAELSARLSRFNLWSTAALAVASPMCALVLNWLTSRIHLSIGSSLLAIGWAVFQYLYLVPSGIVGVLGDRSVLDKLLRVSGLLVIIQIGLYFVLTRLGHDAVNSMLVASFLSQVVRVVNANHFRRLVVSVPPSDVPRAVRP
jgi:hypothetical protein